MNITWSDFKEGFLVIGSAAGVIALLRPIVESKFTRDLKRVEHITSLIDEQSLIDLEARIYQTRQVPDEQFHPFDQLLHERRTRQDVVRFTGPQAKYLARELDSLIAAYRGLREYIQVNEWEPRKHQNAEGQEYTSWDFNKSAFAKETGYPKDYAGHLDGAATKAAEMRRAYQRLQLVAELHLLEVPFARWLLERRFKAHELKEPT